MAFFQEKDDLNYDNNIISSVFSDLKVKNFYKPIKKYKKQHKFDMHAIWFDKKEKTLIQRVS